MNPDGLLVWESPTSARARRGAIAGTGHGDRHFIRLDGATYSARALAHLYQQGEWPAGFVDRQTGLVFSISTKGEALTAERLRQVLKYEPSTGIFTWSERTSKCARIGAVAGSKCGNGYLRTHIFGREYLLHRLAWMYMHGEFPAQMIDHINGVRDDNRIENLRQVSHRVNIQNQRRAMVTNKLGVLGVRQRTKGCFEANINLSGIPTCLGSFPTAEAAHAAYLEAKRRHHAGCTI